MPRFRRCAGLDSPALWLAAVVFVLAGAQAAPPESNPPSAPMVTTETAPLLPQMTGAGLAMVFDGGHADCDIVMTTERDPEPVRAAIQRLTDGTGWTLEQVKVEVKSTARLDRHLKPLRQTAASFHILGPLLQREGELPIAVFAAAFADLMPFDWTFAVPQGLRIVAPERWDSATVGARLRPAGGEGQYEYYIAAPSVLALLDPKTAAPQPVAPGPHPPSLLTVLLWLAGVALVAAAAGMVRLYVVRRSRKPIGGRDGSRSTLPTSR